MAFSPDGKLLASGDNVVRLWDVTTGRELRSFGGGTVLRVVFSPNGKTLASSASSNAQTVQLWEVASGKEVHQFGGHALPVPSFAFSPDSKVLATGDPAGSIHLWDMATYQERGQLGGAMKPDPRSSYALGPLAFSPDGRSLAVGHSDETVRLWEVASGRERARFHGHRHGVTSLAFSPDGTLLASGSWDRTVIVWDARGQRGASRQRQGDLDAKKLNSLWADLASADAGKAYQAIRVLLTAGKIAVPFLKEQLRPADTGDPKRVALLLADLDSDRFAVREKATVALLELGDQAEPALRAALASKPSSEVRRRAERVVNQLNPANSPVLLRPQRAVEALEHIGTPEARQVLQTLCEGAPEARLTREAKAALQRLSRP